MKKTITFGIVFLLLVGIVLASLNIGAHTTKDFGVMQPKEIKTLSYYVKGFYEADNNYYSVCVKHPIEGEIKDWIKLKLDETNNLTIYQDQTCKKGRAFNEHWVGPELKLTWIKNVHITLKIPPKTKAGNYTATINNMGCFKSGMINLCNNVPTTIKVEVK